MRLLAYLLVLQVSAQIIELRYHLHWQRGKRCCSTWRVSVPLLVQAPSGQGRRLYLVLGAETLTRSTFWG